MQLERDATILVVDDEASVRNTTAALLEDHYQVLVASSGKEALALLRSHRVDVICTDFSMPGMNGIELLRQACQISPSVIGIIISGAAEYHEAKKETDKAQFLLKPYDPEVLYEMLGRATRLARLKRSAADMAVEATRLPGRKGAG